MKRLLFFFLFGPLFVFAQKKAKVLYDGIYQSMPIVDYDTSYSYIRFYKSGKVLTVTSTGKPNDLKKWFNLKMNDPSVGKYKVQDQKISFASTSKHGTVNYEGEVQDSRTLFLHIKSLINGHESDKEYHFVKIPGLNRKL